MAESFESSLISRSQTLTKASNEVTIGNLKTIKSGSVFIGSSVQRFNRKDNPQFTAYNEDEMSKDLIKYAKI